MAQEPKSRVITQKESDARRGMKTIGFKVPTDFADYLDTLSKTTGKPKNKLVMDAVKTYYPVSETLEQDKLMGILDVELIQKRLFAYLQSFEKIEDDMRYCTVSLTMFKNLAALADERTLLLSQDNLEGLFVDVSRQIQDIAILQETEKGKVLQMFLEKFVINDEEDVEHNTITHITYYFA